jgi:hypothetical protein
MRRMCGRWRIEGVILPSMGKQFRDERLQNVLRAEPGLIPAPNAI